MNLLWIVSLNRVGVIMKSRQSLYLFSNRHSGLAVALKAGMTHVSVIDKCLAHLFTNIRETVGSKGIDFGFLRIVKHAITGYNTDGDPWEEKHSSKNR